MTITLGIIASLAGTAHSPVIPVSAHAMALDVERGLRAGLVRNLSKPIRVDGVMPALNAAPGAAFEVA